MKIEVLISTMNLKEPETLLKEMNVQTPYKIINQVKEIKQIKDKNVYSYQEKGVSKSRNRALQKAEAEICIIADDDVKYVDNYEKIILEAYKKYPKADIIVFKIKSLDKERKVKNIWRKKSR